MLGIGLTGKPGTVTLGAAGRGTPWPELGRSSWTC